jgi:hypothetical protein
MARTAATARENNSSYRNFQIKTRICRLLRLDRPVQSKYTASEPVIGGSVYGFYANLPNL